MNSPCKYTFFTGISISDDIFSIHKRVTKTTYGAYDDLINIASLSVTTASSLALAHTVTNQFEQSLADIRESKSEHQKAFDIANDRISSIQNPDANEVFFKQSAEVSNTRTSHVSTVIGLPAVIEGAELSTTGSELKSAYQSMEDAKSKIQECAERESKLAKSQVHIGTQDYLFFFMNNAKSLTQIQEIIEKKGFDYNLLKPKVITISVNAVMYFGYNKYLHPQLPNSIIGNDKASATFKLVVNTGASIAVTSILTFGDKLYNLAHDALFGEADITKKEEEKGLDNQKDTHDEIAKEIVSDDGQVNHEEL